MTVLNLNCTIHYNKWTKYGLLFTNNPTAVALRPVFKTEAVKFVGYLNNEVLAVNTRANADLTDITTAKVLAKQMASDALGMITSNCLSFAILKNLTILKGQMRNATSAKLMKEKDENFVGRSESLNEVLTGVLTDYPVDALDYFTAAQVTDAMNLVSDFEGKQGAWALADADVNNAKIEFELEWMPKMASSLMYLESLLPGTITSTYPTFASSFISLKKLVRTGVKNQGVWPTMVDSLTGALFVKDGKMETVNYTGTMNQKVVMTDSLGLFKLMKLKIGIWKIRFSAPGYVEQVIEVKIDRRKVLVPSIKLVKVV